MRIVDGVGVRRDSTVRIRTLMCGSDPKDDHYQVSCDRYCVCIDCESFGVSFVPSSGEKMNGSTCVVDRLTESKFGRILRQDQIAALAEIASEHQFAAGTRMFGEGCPADAMWVVCSGEVDVRMTIPTEGESTILKLGASDLLGWSALVGDGKMSAAAVVSADAELISLPAEALKELCLNDHTMGYAIMGTVAFTLATRLKATRQQLLEVAARSEFCRPLAVRVAD